MAANAPASGADRSQPGIAGSGVQGRRCLSSQSDAAHFAPQPVGPLPAGLRYPLGDSRCHQRERNTRYSLFPKRAVPGGKLNFLAQHGYYFIYGSGLFSTSRRSVWIYLRIPKSLQLALPIKLRFRLPTRSQNAPSAGRFSAGYLALVF